MITAVSTIAGGLVGGFATYFTTTRIENNRLTSERETQNTIRVNIRTLIRQELQSYSNFLNRVKQVSDRLKDLQGNAVDELYFVRDDLFDEIQNQRNTLTKEYDNLDFDRKMLVFGAQSYLIIEKAYGDFRAFRFVNRMGHNGCFTRVETVLNSVIAAINNIPN